MIFNEISKTETMDLLLVLFNQPVLRKYLIFIIIESRVKM